MVLAVKCKFCIYFERETKPGAKRKRTSNVKYFKKPFCEDNYVQHHKQQHSEKWKQYLEASDAEKRAFFNETTPVKETLFGHFGSKQITKIFLIDQSIVENIIGEMFWDSEEPYCASHQRMMMAFGDLLDPSEDEDNGNGTGTGKARYTIVIKNPL